MGRDDDAQHRGWIRDQLDAALRRLTWSAGNQIEWLTSLGLGNAGELAIEYGDMTMVANQLPELSELTLERLKVLDDLLLGISGKQHADLWSFEAVRSSGIWGEVRTLASEAVESWDADWARMEH